MNEVWGTKERYESSKDVQKNKLLPTLRYYPTFCLTEPQSGEDLRGSQYLRAVSASSLPLRGGRHHRE